MFRLVVLIVLVLNFSSVFSTELQTRALLIAQTEALLSSQITGRILEVNVDLGQPFKKNDVLIEFDCEVQKATRDRVRATLKAASVTVKSHKKLRELGSISQLELAQAEAEELKARADLREITAQIKMCTIKAPFSGRVVSRKIDAYETVTQGEELIEIIDDSSLAVDLLVPSNWTKWLKQGLEFDISVAETGDKVKATVQEIGARIDPVSQTIAVRGKLLKQHQAGLLAGMSGQAIFTLPE